MNIILLYFKQLCFNIGMKIPFTDYIISLIFIIIHFSGTLGDYLLKNLSNCYTTWSLITANFLYNLLFY